MKVQTVNCLTRFLLTLLLFTLSATPAAPQETKELFPPDLECTLVTGETDTLTLHFYQVWEDRNQALLVARGLSQWVSVRWIGNTVVIAEETLAGYTNVTVIWRREFVDSDVPRVVEEMLQLQRYRAELSRGVDGAKWVGYCQSSYGLELWRADSGRG